MSWDRMNNMLSKFNFTFTWKYCGDGELRSILPDVFRILDDEDERYMDDQKMQYSWLLNDLFLLKIIFKVLQNICLSMYYTLLQFLQLVKSGIYHIVHQWPNIFLLQCLPGISFYHV